MNNKKRVKTSLFSAFLGATLLFLSGCNTKSDTTEVFSTIQKENTPAPTVIEEVTQPPTINTVLVYLCGQVNQPDVYEVSGTARIKDVLELAGGFTEEAAREAVNLARLVVDGEQIYIPSKEEVEQGFVDMEQGGRNEGVTNTESFRININTATKEELMTLPGIGLAKAESILTFRQTQGAFQSIEDIMNIEGIKEGVFSKIKELITVQ